MPKIKLLQGFSGAVDGNYDPKAGDVIEVSAPTADDLVKRGRAEKVAAKKAAKKAATESASTSAPEAAMKPKAEPRDG